MIFDDFYGNANTSPRRPGLRYQWYTDQESEVTGETDVFHLEAKCQGSAALRRIGINHPRDLIKFDHGKFWRAQLPGAFFDCDRERLGRYHANQRNGTKRRTPLIHRTKSGFVFNVDAAVGNVLWRVHAAHEHRNKKGIIRDVPMRSMQRFVDQYGRGPFLLCISANNLHSDCNHHTGHENHHLQHHLAAYLSSLTDIELYPLHQHRLNKSEACTSSSSLSSGVHTMTTTKPLTSKDAIRFLTLSDPDLTNVQIQRRLDWLGLPACTLF